MTTAWSALLTEKTPRQQFAEFVQALKTRGWPATAWQSGDVGHTLVEISSQVLADLSRSAVSIAQSGFLSTAHDGWLDLLAEEFYGLKRKGATFCERELALSVDGAAAAVHKAAGQLTVSDGTGRYRFVNGEAVNVNPGETKTLRFRSERPGKEYNAVTPTTLNVAVPGLTVTVPDDDLLAPGNDAELDPSLRQRCRDSWAQLGMGAPAAAYVYWAQQASEEVRRVQVLPPEGNGVVRVRLAAGSQLVSEAAVATVIEDLSRRIPITAQLDVQAATPVPVNVTATLYGPAQYAGQAITEAETNLEALLNGLPIGQGGDVYRAAIIEELMRPAGVVNAVLAAPLADLAIADGFVAQPGIFDIQYVAM